MAPPRASSSLSFFLCFLCFPCFFCLVFSAFFAVSIDAASSSSSPASASTYSSSSAALPALYVNGTQLYAASGTPVTLRGFNAGNWLGNEIWMTPIVSKSAPPAAGARRGGAAGARRGGAAAAAEDHRRGAAERTERVREDLAVNEGHRRAPHRGPEDHRPAGVVAAAETDLLGVQDPRPVATQPVLDGPALDAAEPADHVSLWRIVQERFGEAGRRAVQAAWRDAWLTAADLARMRAAGLNSLRLPFLADNLLGDDPFIDFADFDPANLTDADLDWARLDQAVGWARDAGLYVVLDMHGAPNRQSVEHHTGEQGRNGLWNDPAAQRLTAHLWTLIAAHYRGDSTIAAIDLLNEPRALPPAQEDENAHTIHALHAELFAAVRRGDPDRIVVVEDGFSGMNRMPYPEDVGWTNVVYSYHSYPENYARFLRTVDDWEHADVTARGVPFYIGEFNLAMHPASFAWPEDLVAAIDDMDVRGISWSAWSYKIVTGRAGWGGTHWAWFRDEEADPAVRPFDPSTDDLPTLLAAAASVGTEILTEDPAWRAALATGPPKTH